MGQVTTSDLQPFVDWFKSSSPLVEHGLKVVLTDNTAQADLNGQWAGNVSYVAETAVPQLIGVLKDNFGGPDMVEVLIQLSDPVRIFLISIIASIPQRGQSQMKSFFLTSNQIVNAESGAGWLFLSFTNDATGEDFYVTLEQTSNLNQPMLHHRLKAKVASSGR
jgi:hypothetical protein